MLCIYGPFLQGAGKHRSISSRVFNAALWLQSSDYGLRALNDLNDASVHTCSGSRTVVVVVVVVVVDVVDVVVVLSLIHI